MRDATVELVRKLKSNDSQYIWQPGSRPASRTSCWAVRCWSTRTFRQPLSAAKSVVFGDLSGYYIRDVGTVAIEASHRALRARRSDRRADALPH